MTKRQQLFYLLKSFIQDEYDVKTFCSAFEEIYYTDTPKDELSVFELSILESLANTITRFSSFDEDIKAYPYVYYGETEAKRAIERACLELIEK